MIALQLAKAGYWGGDPEKVLQAPSDIVVIAAEFEKFRNEYERTAMEMNRDKK